ncbi:ORF A102a [Sulfolobus virus Ragged Hills]|uniref:ORF A102a n=1 Tax=Sulfolobus virus Ragged Hills TaxID=256994 RepID=Q6TRU7_9VIRU|nr:ORF A102a [Sulfolobus virus Ragged Hills]AAR27914.1 ORF A102a [Sulfolobus virus Ragged Hills]
MVEPQYQEKVLGEVSLNFFIRSVEVEGRHNFYFKLYVRIKDDKNGTEIDQQFLSPEEYETHRILKDIEKLYNLTSYSQNEKLAQGAKEEILKLIALLLSRVS